jgi:hypothetical protein
MTTTTNYPHRGSPGSSQGVLSRTRSRASYFESSLHMLPGMNLPLRSMLVAGDGRQFLISPVGTADEASQIGSDPLLLLAPSLLHHVHLPRAIERYRPVALWGPPGFAEKKPELGPVHTFGVDPWSYDDQLAFTVVEGAPRRNEVVFFHRASRTIYTADLLLNLQQPTGWLSSIALRVMGVHGRLAPVKLWKHWVTDRAAFSRSIEHILAWDFERIVMAHGTPVEDNAHERFEIALRELNLIE